ncbi:MAG TPA: hypothetical protein VF261_01730 [Candidatus Saccharimonadales bacterium]
MSDTLVAILFGLGIGGWVYSQLARRSGNANPGSTFTVAGIVGLVAAIIIFTVFKFILHI